jgi:hypothetical protein
MFAGSLVFGRVFEGDEVLLNTQYENGRIAARI